MIDYLSLALGHGLLALMALMLLMRDDLDDDPALGALDEAITKERHRASKARREKQHRASGQSGQTSTHGAPPPTPQTLGEERP
ncbi:MAG: hypothetical protein AAFY07_07920 [Pseudomonadota bacterium]